MIQWIVQYGRAERFPKEVIKLTASVLVLNASYEVLSFVEWQRAISLVVMDTADIIESFPDKVIRSQHQSYPFPKAIKLRQYVHVRWTGKARDIKPSKTHVLARDLFTCIYCGSYADTIDHIIPKSRRGPETWENLGAACFSCNNVKGDRTPQEAGMRLLWEPYEFTREKFQRRRLKQLELDALAAG